MLEHWLINSDEDLIAEKRREADVLFQRLGITFNVYGEDQGADRLIPFDLIPRVISASDWHILQTGLRQRVQALNRCFALPTRWSNMVRTIPMPRRLSKA